MDRTELRPDPERYQDLRVTEPGILERLLHFARHRVALIGAMTALGFVGSNASKVTSVYGLCATLGTSAFIVALCAAALRVNPQKQDGSNTKASANSQAQSGNDGNGSGKARGAA
jgi:hypothetical protein